MKQIMNGGLELGIFKIVGDDALSEADRKRKAYLESLPKNVWITLDENGMAVTDDQAREMERAELAKYGIEPEQLDYGSTK